MFGQNPVAKNELHMAGDALTVVNGMPFYTIQGEGPHAGRPAMFLRLHGCPLRCYFCDTHFSSPTDPLMSVQQIVDLMTELWPVTIAQKLAVITGGEPTRQNLKPLIQELLELGWWVQIETAGLFWQDIFAEDYVDIVVSPKSRTINHLIYDHAAAFKYIIKAGEVDLTDGLPLTNTQVEGGPRMPLARPRPRAEVFLSPMDEGNEAANGLNRRAVAEIAMKHGYRAGLQLHKFMDLP